MNGASEQSQYREKTHKVQRVSITIISPMTSCSYLGPGAHFSNRQFESLVIGGVQVLVVCRFKVLHSLQIMVTTVWHKSLRIRDLSKVTPPQTRLSPALPYKTPERNLRQQWPMGPQAEACSYRLHFPLALPKWHSVYLRQTRASTVLKNQNGDNMALGVSHQMWTYTLSSAGIMKVTTGS